MSPHRSPPDSHEVNRNARQLSEFEGVNVLLYAAVISSSPHAEPYTEQDQSGECEASRTGDSEICETTPTRRDRYTGPRPPRPQYTEEQEDAIRFYRDDLCMTWTQVMNAYNDLYDRDTGRQWESRSISGLQSRYYRLLDIPVNHAKKQSKPRPDLGILVMKPHKRYWWMGQAGEERVKSSTYDSQAEEGYSASDGDDDGEDEATRSQDEGKFSFFTQVLCSLIPTSWTGPWNWAYGNLPSMRVACNPSYQLLACIPILRSARWLSRLLASNFQYERTLTPGA